LHFDVVGSPGILAFKLQDQRGSMRAAEDSSRSKRGLTRMDRAVFWTVSAALIVGCGAATPRQRDGEASEAPERSSKAPSKAPRLVIANRCSTSLEAISWSPDGATIASWGAVGEREVLLWDMRTGASRGRVEARRGGVDAAAFGPDGRSLAVADSSGDVVLFDLHSGAPIRALEAVPRLDRVRLSFSPDGETLGAVGSAKVVLWDTRSGALRRILEDELAGELGLAFSPDGASLAVSDSSSGVRLWDAKTLEVRLVIEPYPGAVTAIAWSSDSEQLVTGGYGQPLYLWDARDGRALKVLSEASIRSVSVSSSGPSLAVVEERGAVRLYDLGTGAAGPELPREQSDSVDSVAFSPDGATIAGVSGRRVYLWDQRTGSTTATIAEERLPLAVLGWSGDGSALLVGGAGRNAALWDLRSGTVSAPPVTHVGGMTRASWSPGDDLVVTLDDEQVWAWEPRSGAVIGSLPEPLCGVTSLAWVGEGEEVLMANVEGRLLRWNPRTGARAESTAPRARGHGLDPLRGPRFSLSPDGTMIVSSQDNAPTRLWDLRDGNELATLGTANGDDLYGVRWHPRGTAVLAWTERGAQVWGVPRGEPRVTFAGASGALLSLAYSADGGRAVGVGREGELLLWDAGSGALLRTWPRLDVVPAAAALSPDGALIAVGAEHLWLYRLSDGERVGLHAVELAPGRVAGAVLTDSGAFSGDPAAAAGLFFRLGEDLIGGEVVSAVELGDRYRRPDLLADFLAGQPLD
jgi:WD40 repeat protein